MMHSDPDSLVTMAQLLHELARQIHPLHLANPTLARGIRRAGMSLARSVAGGHLAPGQSLRSRERAGDRRRRARRVGAPRPQRSDDGTRRDSRARSLVTAGSHRSVSRQGRRRERLKVRPAAVRARDQPWSLRGTGGLCRGSLLRACSL
jgi:hypothetical protein